MHKFIFRLGKIGSEATSSEFRVDVFRTARVDRDPAKLQVNNLISDIFLNLNLQGIFAIQKITTYRRYIQN